MKILVTGGTGFVGRPLVKKLATKHQVLVLTRKPSQSSPDKSNITLVGWDLTKNQFTYDLSDIDGVINLMGENIASKRWSKKQKRKIASSRIDGTAKLITHLQENLRDQLQFFISASAIGIYKTGDEQLNEDSPEGRGYLTNLCRQWENQVHKLSDSKCKRKVIVRIGVVLGKNGGAFKKLHLPFKLGLGGPIADGRQWMSWIHLDDLVEILEQTVSNSSFNGVYNAVSPNPVTNKEFTKQLASILKRPAVFTVPKIIFKLAMGELSCIVLDSQKVVPRNLLNNSFHFRFPTLREALVNLCNKK